MSSSPDAPGQIREQKCPDTRSVDADEIERGDAASPAAQSSAECRSSTPWRTTEQRPMNSIKTLQVLLGHTRTIATTEIYLAGCGGEQRRGAWMRWTSCTGAQ